MNTVNAMRRETKAGFGYVFFYELEPNNNNRSAYIDRFLYSPLLDLGLDFCISRSRRFAFRQLTLYFK